MPKQSTTPAVLAAREAALVRAAIAFFFPQQAADAGVDMVTGGLSGSLVLRVVLPSGAVWALKQFPAACDAERAVWLHRLMQHLRAAPLRWIPEVAGGLGGSVWHDGSGGLWEMLSWMPGRPLLEPRMEAQRVMIEAVATLHARAASFGDTPAGTGIARALRDRLDQCRRLLLEPWGRRYGKERSCFGWASPERDGAARLADALRLASEILQADGEQALRRIVAWEPRPVPEFAVLRDVTADHFLLSGAEQPVGSALCADAVATPEVTGLIDFHAARLDSPACDLARLLGSWHAGLPPREAIEHAVGWYLPHATSDAMPGQNARQLAALIEFLAATGVVLGLDNWFRWLIEEERHFSDADAVLARVERHLAALEQAFCRLSTMPPLM